MMLHWNAKLPLVLVAAVATAVAALAPAGFFW